MRLVVLFLCGLTLSGCHFLTDKELDQKIKDANYAGMIIGYKCARAEAFTRFEEFMDESKRPIEPLSGQIEDEIEDFKLVMRN